MTAKVQDDDNARNGDILDDGARLVRSRRRTGAASGGGGRSELRNSRRSSTLSDPLAVDVRGCRRTAVLEVQGDVPLASTYHWLVDGAEACSILRRIGAAILATTLAARVLAPCTPTAEDSESAPAGIEVKIDSDAQPMITALSSSCHNYLMSFGCRASFPSYAAGSSQAGAVRPAASAAFRYFLRRASYTAISSSSSFARKMSRTRFATPSSARRFLGV